MGRAVGRPQCLMRISAKNTKVSKQHVPQFGKHGVDGETVILTAAADSITHRSIVDSLLRCISLDRGEFATVSKGSC